jgi:two-component system, LytTR family, sensor kinase
VARAPASVIGGVNEMRTVARTVTPTVTSAEPTAIGVEWLIGAQPARWWALGGSWLAVAFSVGFGLYVNSEARGGQTSFFSALMATLPHYFVWALTTPAIYRALHKAIEGERRWLWLLRLTGWSVVALAGSTAMSFTSYVVRHDLSAGLDQFIALYILPPVGPAFHSMNLSILVLALVACATVRALRLRDLHQWEAAQAELRGARLEAQLADARLETLQAQIHPHFVLNSLNSIAGLVQAGERDRAFDAIGKLGELLQFALRDGTGINLTLGEEVDFLQRYLKLCELRFESRFHYCMSVPEALRSRRMPALIVQPLIENAVRHGMQLHKPLMLGVRAYERDGLLVIEVEDDGRGISPERARTLVRGHGLANVAERLRLFFGDASELKLEARPGGGTLARITCPAT